MFPFYKLHSNNGFLLFIQNFEKVKVQNDILRAIFQFSLDHGSV